MSPMLVGQTGRTRCPRCGGQIPASKLLFREDFHCVRCDAPLHVGVTYSRVLVLLSLLVSLAVLWATGARDVRLLLFYLPLGFLILTIVVRLAPFVVPPRLQLGKPTAFTRLDLS